MERGVQIDVEERSVHALHERNLATAVVSLAVGDIVVELVLLDDVGVLGSRALDAMGLALDGIVVGLDTVLCVVGLVVKRQLALVVDDFGMSGSR